MTNAELVEKIKRILEDPESSTGEEQQEAARVYASRLRKVDEGMRRALGQLNSGALSDAYRIITDGALLEEYAGLSFGGSADWRVVCRTFDYEVAPTLDDGARAQLALFRDQYEPVNELFARRRRQAMENAPSLSQLETLYRIEELFGAHDFLSRQIENLERRRNDELASALHSVTAENVLALDFKALIAEFRDARRHTPVSNEVLRKYKSWYEYAQSCHELDALRDLIARWQTASEDQDAYAILEMLQEYRQGEYKHAAAFVTDAEMNALSELVDHALKLERAETLRHDAQRKAETLRAALLRSTTDVDKLHDLWEAAEVAANNAGVSIPPDVEKDYRRATNALDTQRRRKRFAVTALVLVVVAFFVALTTLSIMHSANVKKATAAAAAIQAYIDAFERHDAKSGPALETAAATIAKNRETNPKFNDVPEYASVVEYFEQLQANEKKRLHDIEDLRDSIDAAHDEGRAVPNLVENLKKLLFNDLEKEKYDYIRLHQEDNNLLYARNEESVKKYSDLVDEMTLKAKELQDSPDLTLNQAGELLHELRAGIAKLKSMESRGEIAQAAVNSRKAVEASVNGSERRLKLRAALESHGSALGAAVGAADEYVKTLQKIKSETAINSDSEPEEDGDGALSSLGATLDAAIVDVANAANAVAWNKIATNWPTVNDSVKTKAASSSATKALAAKGLAFAPEFKEYQETRKDFDKFAERGGYSNSASMIASALEKLKTQTWTFYDSKDDRYYYLTSAPERGKSNLKYLADPDDESTKGFAVDNFDSEKVAASKPSVQYTIAKKASDAFRTEPTPERWFEVVEFALRELNSAEEQTLDPVVKLQTLAVFVLASESYPGFEELHTWLETTRKTSGFDFSINAYQPSKELLEQREIAKKALRDAPDLVKTLASVKTAFDDGARPLGRKYQWIGYLDDVNSEPKLVVGTGKKAPEGATLWLARGADATAEQIGVMSKDGATFSTTRDLTQCRWSPVYVRVE